MGRQLTSQCDSLSSLGKYSASHIRHSKGSHIITFIILHLSLHFIFLFRRIALQVPTLLSILAA